MKINCCPSSLKKGFINYSNNASVRLFGCVDVSCFLQYNIDLIKVINTSKEPMLQGLQPKSFGYIKNNVISLEQEDDNIPTHILKLNKINAGFLNETQMVANEHLTMQIAEQVYGIETATNGICFSQTGEQAYITKRFDIISGNIYSKEDFMVLLNRDDKYNGTYEEVGEIIREYSSEPEKDVCKFFKLILFNYIFCNGDAHLMNFTLVKDKKRTWLSPAYDLLNTLLHLNDARFALRGGLLNDDDKIFYNENGVATIDTFFEFARRLDIDDDKTLSLINLFRNKESYVKELIDLSFLNSQCKKLYYQLHKRIYNFFFNIKECTVY